MISTTTLEELISAEEAAKLLGLHEQTLAKWRCTGQQSLPFIRVGRAVRYRRRDIEAWLNSRTVRRASNT